MWDVIWCQACVTWSWLRPQTCLRSQLPFLTLETQRSENFEWTSFLLVCHLQVMKYFRVKNYSFIWLHQKMQLLYHLDNWGFLLWIVSSNNSLFAGKTPLIWTLNFVCNSQFHNSSLNWRCKRCLLFLNVFYHIHANFQFCQFITPVLKLRGRSSSKL